LRRDFDDAAGFASCYGPLGCSPSRAFDTGLRHRELPLDAASLLQGRLAATPAGLTPASNDEHDQSSTAHAINLQSSGRTAEAIKDQLARFLRDDLALELHPGKTLVTHARTRAARYLGYEITVRQCDDKVTRGRRSVNGDVALRIPLDVVKTKRAPYLCHGNPGTGRPYRTWTTTKSSRPSQPNTGASSATIG
jgi:hypothetical protein